MAGPLRNARWEVFAQAVANGKVCDFAQSTAYMQAGYKSQPGNAAYANASRLAKLQPVLDRIRELQAEEAKKRGINRESLLGELNRATEIAERKEQAQGVVQSAMAKARLLGLDVQKIEQGQPGDFSEPQTKREAAEAFLKTALKDRTAPITQQMIDAAVIELARFSDAITSIGNLDSPLNQRPN